MTKSRRMLTVHTTPSLQGRKGNNRQTDRQRESRLIRMKQGQIEEIDGKEAASVRKVVKEGREKGREKGMEEGMEEGMMVGTEEGMKEGMEEGVEEGMEEGRNEGTDEVQRRV